MDCPKFYIVTDPDSAITSDNYSCFLEASKMSCETMKEMARVDYTKNMQYQLYPIEQNNPQLCNQISDKKIESDLQKGSQLSRNLCFNKDNLQTGGEWINQFMYDIFPTQSFLRSTKAKSK